jgi:hypothetical protein
MYLTNPLSAITFFRNVYQHKSYTRSLHWLHDIQDIVGLNKEDCVPVNSIQYHHQILNHVFLKHDK